jgi:hypothetical protein
MTKNLDKTLENKTGELNDGIYTVNIDFDESSKEWRSNKIKKENGTYTYKKNK